MTPARWYFVTYLDMDSPPGSPGRCWTDWLFGWPGVGEPVHPDPPDGRRRVVHSVFADIDRPDDLTVAVGRLEESAFDMERVWPLEALTEAA